MNRKTNKTAPCLAVLSVFISLMAWATSAGAVVVDFTTLDMTAGPDSLSFTAGGVNGVARGYHVEIDTGTNAGTIYGPFSTATATDSANFTVPYFGRTLNKSDGSLTGLGLLSLQNFGQTDSDKGGAVQQPGFDNRSLPASNTTPSFQFALFSFDAPVDVSQVIPGAVSNFPDHMWIAGGSSAPDLNADFLTAFAGYTFINSPDPLGPPVHNFSPLTGIRYLAIGAMPYQGDLGAATYGPLDTVTASSQFYIDGINLTAVPLPPAAWLLASGLLAILGAGRRRS